ncbi:GreA/GreB family elongation factor [Sabulilitoribacter multivorans]|uniref:GreA/GreB family elongation factor n=1 Tax=Flaviramulus multivorans TaxID=1304750 RepID=A0ABS9IFX2_9FLAO|nr:GreA/GreB family elongation factor [Flaviramulus multivorans]MCF7559515.1 GreA/GreB family elongation factor [Flaviramulus multivorans]
MEKNVKIKQWLYNACMAFIDGRLQTVQNTINEIHESLLSETKSSAGDKHETGRAMLQLEREKAGNQLAEIKKTKELLSKIDTIKESKIVRLGSVVYTSKSNYYIAISAGELEVENQKFYAISPNTPIGLLLIGKKVNDEVNFRGESFRIEQLL